MVLLLKMLLISIEIEITVNTPRSWCDEGQYLNKHLTSFLYLFNNTT